jgi:large subunit ribosomal protein L1
MKHGKKYVDNQKKVDSNREYPLEEAIELLKNMKTSNFDEGLEFSTRLGVNPKHADQQVRGTVMLPHGTGKKVSVLVFAQGDKEREALEAGADYVGSDEYIEKINSGWFDFDVAISTPDMMREVGKLGRFLGPRGLMPSPKAGTVTADVERAVKEVKAGKLEYRCDKNSNVHVQVGKISFEKEKLSDNVRAIVKELIKSKPPAAKGKYFLSISISTTMGPSIKLDKASIVDIVR